MKDPTMLSASSAFRFSRAFPTSRCTTSLATSGISPTSSRPIVASTSSTKASNLWKSQGAISRATPSHTTNSTFSCFPKSARHSPRKPNSLRFPTTTWPSIGSHLINQIYTEQVYHHQPSQPYPACFIPQTRTLQGRSASSCLREVRKSRKGLAPQPLCR